MKANEQRSRFGNFQFCIDLGLGADQTAISDHQRLSELTSELFSLFAAHQLPATWAPSFTMAGRVAESIKGSNIGHELAVLGHAGWMGDSIRREHVAQSLKEHLQSAKRFDLPVTSVVLRDSEGDVHHDLFAKNGIRVVRQPLDQNVSPRANRDPVVTRRGAWYVEASAKLPAIGMILGRFDVGYRGKQSLRRSLKRRAAEHLAISATELLANPKFMKPLAQVVRHAALGQVEGPRELTDRELLRLDQSQDAQPRRVGQEAQERPQVPVRPLPAHGRAGLRN